MTILVTGANGTTGSAVVRALVERGAPVRALVRHPDKLAATPGVEVAIGDFDDADSLAAALVGVDHAYLVGASSPDQVSQEAAFIDAAVAAGVEHIVALSVIGADSPGVEALRFGAAHQRVEAALTGAAIEHTLLRPNGFFQNLLGQAAAISGANAIFSPLSPAAGVSYVDVEDIAAVAALALTEPGHTGKAYTLTGPEALTDDEIAVRFTQVLGRPIAHTQVPLEATKEALAGSGYPQWNVDGLAELFAFYETGGAAGVAPDIEQVLGRPARTIEDFIRANRSAFDPS